MIATAVGAEPALHCNCRRGFWNFVRDDILGEMIIPYSDRNLKP